MSFTEGCLICGKELLYAQISEEKICYYCGNESTGNVNCPDDHFICDTCHSSSANDLIETFCNHTDLIDPMEIAIILMHNTSITMHGPEHHYLVPAVLLAAYVNSNKDLNINKASVLRIAKLRASKVPGGFCGTHGNCGAGVGTGIFISIITGSTPLAKEEWKLGNTMTAKSLLAIAEQGGPRCCKRDSFIAISTSAEFLEKHFNTKLPVSKVVCEFSGRNKQCLFEMCDYFPGKD